MVEGDEPSVGEWAATSQHIQQMSNQRNLGRRARHLSLFVGCHLKGAPPLQEGRTSQFPCAKIFLNQLQSLANQFGFVPFDHLLDFCLYFVFNLVPTCLFIFPFADFY
jgi:hypothetical protein